MDLMAHPHQQAIFALRAIFHKVPNTIENIRVRFVK